MINEVVMDHFKNPRNVGEIPDADGVGEVGNPACGDIMTFYIKVKDNILEDVKFQTFGCEAGIAVSSMVSEMAKGKSLEEAMKITKKSVIEALNGLPKQKHHCFNLGADAPATSHQGLPRQNGRQEIREAGRSPRRLLLRYLRC